jgi:hypothetical protein
MLITMGRQLAQDWPNFKKIPKRKYDTAKATSSKERVVFMGDQ